jgi:hypothetical protein
VSRNGTVRNTDSFFKDETVETRKITLTPNLLRDDSAPGTLRPSDIMKERQSSSFDLDKTDRFKEDKKKEKKGVLSIFKRKKDKKSKYMEGEAVTSKTSSELSRESPPSSERTSLQQEVTVQRKPSKGKLQKANINGQRNIMSPTGPGVQSSIDKSTADSTPLESNTSSRAESPEKPTNGPNDKTTHSIPASQTLTKKSSLRDPSSQSPDAADRLSESPVHVTAADAEPPALVRDSSSDSDDVRSFQDTPSPQLPNGVSLDVSNHDRAMSNGIHGHSPISPIAAQLGVGSGIPSALSRMPPHPTRSPPPQPGGDRSPLTVVPSSNYPDRQGSTSTTASAAPSSTPSTPVWSDASLRQYLDESGTSDIRDLLLLTRDTTGIVPVGADHPLMANLFVEERGKVREMGAALDGLLDNWIEKKMRSKSALGQRKPSKT